MKRRDALKGLSLLGLFSIGTSVPATEASAPAAPKMPEGLRQLWEQYETVRRVRAMSSEKRAELVALLRSEGNDGVADVVERIGGAS